MGHRTRPAGSRAVLGWTLLSAIAPGAAHLRAGWRRTGFALLGCYAALLLGALWLWLSADGDLVGKLTNDAVMTTATIALAVLGLAWFALVLHSYLILSPGKLPQAGQIVTGSVAGLLAVAVMLPFGLATQYVWISQETINSVFKEPTEPQAARHRPEDPWAGRTRVNILLLGGDADDNRIGVRTDSMNMASIDVKTGNTVLLSLPRNLEDVRFPPDSPMARRFPQGFRLPTDPAGGRSDLLNSVWEYADAHPEIFGGKKGQGAKALMDAIGWTLGLKIDWYALVNMWGFARLIDAIGGVTITVERDVVFGKYNEGLVKAGTRKLKGADAMWYARSRTYSDDFTRMRRQRCVLGALLTQADPATVLTRFNKIALATRELVQTDIPRTMLEHLVPLALKVQNARVTSVQFVPPLINTGYPDWGKIRAVTLKALKDSVAPRPAASATPLEKPSDTTSQKPKPSDLAAPKGITDGCSGL
ncbi:LCP family protein [Nonomuraea sp. NPDC059194]|uniref:LCP family protein n=1 Tax=Nonomuraea sp. NPDC059194 TaxID=3346764 RepID=UPI0036C27FFB